MGWTQRAALMDLPVEKNIYLLTFIQEATALTSLNTKGVPCSASWIQATWWNSSVESWRKLEQLEDHSSNLDVTASSATSNPLVEAVGMNHSGGIFLLEV